MQERISQPWTPEVDEQLRRLAEEGLTARTISEYLNRTQGAIRMRARALDIVLVKGMSGGVPWSNAEDQRLRELAKAGLNVVEIAAEMHRSTSSVRSHAENLKIKIARGINGMVSGAMTERLTRSVATSSPRERIESASKEQ